MISTELSLVRVDPRPYRIIAQENWGLTRDQMKGMHVHHRIPRSKGGTNDPSNLYVCSSWYHENVWHFSQLGFVGIASEGGKIGGKIGGPKLQSHQKGIFDPSNQPLLKEWGRLGGLIGGTLGDRSKKAEGGQNGGYTTSSQVWESTIDGFKSNAGGVTLHNIANGWDPKARKRIS